MYSVGDLEAPFEITKQFDIDPVMVRDPVPTDGPAPLGGDGTIEGNRALVLGRGARRWHRATRPPSTASTGRASGTSSPARRRLADGTTSRCRTSTPRS